MLNISIAIDGPAGAGKSTIAKIIGNKLNIMYINTGSMYRAVTLMALKNNIEPYDIESLKALINSMNISFNGNNIIVNGKDLEEDIRMPIINNNVSKYAAVEEVRELLVSMQQNISKKYNVVMDGRDIGTVVLKDAPYKFFITASAEVRAKRRLKELEEKGINISFQDVLKEIKERDYIDSNRKVNPLKQSKDAILIDTSNFTIEEVVDKICNIIKRD
ncbi:(d)CMP kinase [Clostridium botulinum]|uniref:Cytidylate kinase n=1 Tax=Clostridium botulinum (strain Langeland / NCTC 10281 / Type F) TaxID=441772 RepID=KCY_CLOBL|nr:(d)CMP kinase [Clostridium botulinum]A7GE53.1 RecName: Full=Cytidylate kinase; Short=CK; AltName: Full=Cytidine monophosphate kinase; Short=CMP kinase [Clostridium botulinum F str. Langeland]ABS42323.1 cytidylate kinase [Clostridium botulinum F str. Langeland]ADF99489.1 cytidylate kinase [Clostridium botulinum F str. 230613]KKM42940.1 cytidylate kinase [Clostridium botulinum]MBY6791546.1 (d)CMP kinase [Clostridium botulinum]MBY6936780.1 (d)CMP kinase [Clostridium botulinum]